MTNKKWFSDALLINRDPNWYGVLTNCDSAEAAEGALRSFFTKFTEHKITDIQLCVFENTSIIPSDAVMWRGLKYLQTEENGIPVSYPWLEYLYRTYTEFGLDPVQIILDTVRAGGIRPWITLRMNDAHFGYDETAFLRDDFFYVAKENGWMIGDRYGYFGHCLDYGCEPVRARMLSFIGEILDKYDIFGLELDFMREIFSFDYLSNPNCRDQMNGFISDVRALCMKAGARRGHPVRLMVRVPRSIEDAYVFGFDVGAWVRNGWIDAIVPTPRWEIVDDAIPVAAWKALVGEDVAVFPGLEILCVNHSMLTHETAKAYSAAWNTQGADGLYFNNHDYATPEHVKVYGLHRDTVLEGTRRYIVTYQDIAAEGNPQYWPLPMTVDGQGTMQLCIGPVRKGERLTVYANVTDGALAMQLDGQMLGEGERCTVLEELDLFHAGERVALTGDSSTYRYSAPGFVTAGSVTLTLQGHGVLDYLEFRIEAE